MQRLSTKDFHVMLAILISLSHLKLHFIALIHPIQWTIANPVGTDRPAKRQKKSSLCMHTGRPALVCTRQVAHRTCFLTRQRDVIASFSFGAWMCTQNISALFFCEILPGYLIFSNSFCYYTLWRLYRLSCHLDKKGGGGGSCGHAMASFDGHAFCARCRDKKKGEDPCVKSPESE